METFLECPAFIHIAASSLTETSHVVPQKSRVEGTAKGLGIQEGMRDWSIHAGIYSITLGYLYYFHLILQITYQ